MRISLAFKVISGVLASLVSLTTLLYTIPELKSVRQYLGIERPPIDSPFIAKFPINSSVVRCNPLEAPTAEYVMPDGWDEAFHDDFSARDSTRKKWNLGEAGWESIGNHLAKAVGQFGRRDSISTKPVFSLGAALDFYVFSDDSSNSIFCRLRGDSSNSDGYGLSLGFRRLEASKLQKNDSTVVTDERFVLSPCIWHRVYYSWRNDTVTVKVDNNSLMQYCDTLSGIRPNSVRVTLGCNEGNGRVYFDNFIVYTLQQPFIDSSPPPPQDTCFWVATDMSVSALLEEPSINILVQEGDSLLFTASSTVQLFRNYSVLFGPEGKTVISDSLPYQGKKIYDAALLGALIGKIGRNGNWFVIGRSTLKVAAFSDTLFLTTNDFQGQFNDNGGAFKILLKRRRCQQLSQL
ncbi:MAG: hypothetical protein NT002_06095 [candidate division Zixibacteria bacterium]|nr:hypothetical protein [candidate division Zixibacteria bacterium]